MIFLFDCSNSEERPSHRGGGGPIINDIMKIDHEKFELMDKYNALKNSLKNTKIAIRNENILMRHNNLRKNIVQNKELKKQKRKLYNDICLLVVGRGFTDILILFSRYCFLICLICSLFWSMYCFLSSRYCF